jgi:hypothetical protein
MIPHGMTRDVSFVVLTKFIVTLDDTTTIEKVRLREGGNVGPPEQAFDPRRLVRHRLPPTHCGQVFWYLLCYRSPYLVRP